MDQQTPAKQANPLLPSVGLVADVSAIIALALTATSNVIIAVLAGFAVVAGAGHLIAYRNAPLGRAGLGAVLALVVGVAALSVVLSRLASGPANTAPPGTGGGTSQAAGTQPATTSGPVQPTASTNRTMPGERSLLALTPLDKELVNQPITVSGVTYSQTKTGQPYATFVGDFFPEEEYTVVPATPVTFRARVGVADEAPTGSSVTFVVTVDGTPAATKVVARGAVDNIEAHISGKSRFGIRMEREAQDAALAGWIDPVIITG